MLQPAGLRPLCQIELAMPSQPAARPITIEWTEWPPQMHGRNCNYPTVLDSALNPWEPILTPNACTTRCGDANVDDSLDLADVVRTINDLFISLTTPEECAESDGADREELKRPFQADCEAVSKHQDSQRQNFFFTRKPPKDPMTKLNTSASDAGKKATSGNLFVLSAPSGGGNKRQRHGGLAGAG